MPKKKVQQIQIIGRRWFDRINGNTYHSVEVYQDNKLVGRNPFAYGYDEHYLTTAHMILQEAGIYPKTDERLPSGCGKDEYDFRMDMRNNRDKFLISVTDVSRKRDL